jgi:hypothetical protein
LFFWTKAYRLQIEVHFGITETEDEKREREIEENEAKAEVIRSTYADVLRRMNDGR